MNPVLRAGVHRPSDNRSYGHSTWANIGTAVCVTCALSPARAAEIPGLGQGRQIMAGVGDSTVSPAPAPHAMGAVNSASYLAPPGPRRLRNSVIRVTCTSNPRSGSQASSRAAFMPACQTHRQSNVQGWLRHFYSSPVCPRLCRVQSSTGLGCASRRWWNKGRDWHERLSGVIGFVALVDGGTGIHDGYVLTAKSRGDHQSCI